MKAIVTLGLAGGFLFAVRGWISLLLVVWVAGRISHGLAMALFKECLKAGGLPNQCDLWKFLHHRSITRWHIALGFHG